MSLSQRLLQYGLLLLLLSLGVDAANVRRAQPSDIYETDGQAGSTPAVYQGDCGNFVSECYQTCFGLGQLRVSYASSLQNGVYSAHCGCGSMDETDVVVSKAGLQTTTTTTLQTTATSVATLTDTSTASTTTTTTATVQTSVCSYSTVVSTVLVTTTIAAQPTTVTTLTTAIITSTVAAAGVYTSSVPAVVVSPGTVAQRKRSVSTFCIEMQLACTVGCAAVWSTTATQVCQANPGSSQYSIACICKNNDNVVQQVIQAFNLVRPASQKCTSIATTKVAATATATATSVATVVVTSRVTVVPNTVVSVYTSVVTATNTYACYTTTPLTSVVTNVVTPTVTAITISSTTTTVTAVATGSYYLAVTTSGQAVPSYVAQTKNSYGLTHSVGSIESAQTFVILQDTSSDTLYNLVGVGPGVFQGLSLGFESSKAGTDPNTVNSFYGFLEALTTHAQGPASSAEKGTFYNRPAETAVWQIDLLSLALQLIWTSPSGATTSLQPFAVTDSEASLGGDKNFAAFEAVYGSNYIPVTYSLVAV